MTHDAPLSSPHNSSSTTTPTVGMPDTARSSSTPRQPVPAPTNLDLDFDINFGDTLGLNFSTGSVTHDVAGHGSRGLLSPHSCLEQDAARSWRKGKARRVSTEPLLSLDITPAISASDPCTGPSTSKLKPKPLRTRHNRASSGSGGSGYGSTDTLLSSSDSEQASSGDMRSRPNWGTVLKMKHPFGHVEQRYIPPPVFTPYYTPTTSPSRETAPTEDPIPQAGPSQLPFIDTTISVTVASPSPSPSHTHPLPGGANLAVVDGPTDSSPPPSPAPTADFSMISPPNSPTYAEYFLSEPHSMGPRGAATLPFFRSNSASFSPSGVFHWNGRSHSVNLGKPRRTRPGISRLWESISSPAKSSPALPLTSSDTSGPAATPRCKLTNAGVRSKTSPMMGVGRKLRERRRVKRRRRSSIPAVLTDVDYGALDPLDGEEGELVGCVCTGWGDGACVCGYGYWDVYDYEEGNAQESEFIADPTPSPLTQLPTELFLHVLSYLPVRSVLAVALTCKAWRTLSLDNGVWWKLWQAREGTTRLPSQMPSQSSDHGRREFDSFPGRGRRYRNVKDEGIGLCLNTPEHEDQWDAPSGWAIDFQRANLMLKEGIGMGAYVHPEKRCIPDGQQLDLTAAEQNGALVEEDTQSSAIMTAPLPAISRQSPLTLDWHRLYRDRAVLEQRWRDPEVEPHVFKIEGHRDSVYCLDFDSSRIMTGSRDRTIKVWCIKTGTCIATFEGHTGSVLCLKFERDWDVDSDGTVRGFMVSGSSDCTVCVWDLISTPVSLGETDKSKNGHSAIISGTFGPPRRVSAEVRQVLRGHSAGVLDLKMDERWIVTCSKDALMNVYDRKTLTLHTILSGHEGPVNAVGLENGRVVSASGDGKMMLWDVETGSCIRVFEGHEKGLACIEFKNDLILSGSNDCTIKLWRASTGECLHTFAGHTLLVRALYFEPQTGYIVSTSYDRSVRVWEWREREPGEDGDRSKSKGVGRLVREFRNLHASHVFDVKFDVGKIVSTSHDQKIIVLDFSRGIEGSQLFV